MSWRFVGLLIGCIALGFTSCKKTSNSRNPGPPLDACTLITQAEIEAIQRSPVKEAKSSTTTGSGFRVSQCFYSTAEFSKSVNLVVTQHDPATRGGQSIAKHWQEMFESHADKDRDEREDREREGETVTPPKKIEGVGDDARWTGMRFGGALYVLKKDVFIRLSVGGGNNDESGVNNAKALALKAIERL